MQLKKWDENILKPFYFSKIRTIEKHVDISMEKSKFFTDKVTFSLKTRLLTSKARVPTLTSVYSISKVLKVISEAASFTSKVKSKFYEVGFYTNEIMRWFDLGDGTSLSSTIKLSSSVAAKFGLVYKLVR